MTKIITNWGKTKFFGMASYDTLFELCDLYTGERTITTGEGLPRNGKRDTNYKITQSFIYTDLLKDSQLKTYREYSGKYSNGVEMMIDIGTLTPKTFAELRKLGSKLYKANNSIDRHIKITYKILQLLQKAKVLPNYNINIEHLKPISPDWFCLNEVRTVDTYTIGFKVSFYSCYSTVVQRVSFTDDNYLLLPIFVNTDINLLIDKDKIKAYKIPKARYFAVELDKFVYCNDNSHLAIGETLETPLKELEIEINKPLIAQLMMTGELNFKTAQFSNFLVLFSKKPDLVYKMFPSLRGINYVLHSKTF